MSASLLTASLSAGTSCHSSRIRGLSHVSREDGCASVISMKEGSSSISSCSFNTLAAVSCSCGFTGPFRAFNENATECFKIEFQLIIRNPSYVSFLFVVHTSMCNVKSQNLEADSHNLWKFVSNFCDKEGKPRHSNAFESFLVFTAYAS